MLADGERSALSPSSVLMRSATRERLRGIYAIVDAEASTNPLALVAAVLRAGVRVVQYRDKRGIDYSLLDAMAAAAGRAGALFIVNDDPAAARRADGVHLGQEDLTAIGYTAARRAIGDRLLGVSCGTVSEARRAEVLGADYLGVGPFNPTPTKRDAGHAIRAAGLRAIAAATSLPIVAIGGIGVTDLESIMRSGASMAAVISAISAATDPFVAARALVEEWATLEQR